MNDEKLPEIPKGWMWMRLGDIVEKISDGSHNPPAKQDSGIPILSAQNIWNNKIIFSEYRYISSEDYKKEIIRTPLETGDVLLTIVGTIGRSAVIKESTPKFAIQRSVASIKSKMVPEYMCFLFQSPFHSSYFLKGAKGTAQKGIYLNQLAVTPIPIPPLPEQRRIVTKLEELFTRLDAGVSELKKTQAQLKRYRQSLLKTACEGKLVPTEAELAKVEGRDYETAAVLLARILKERQEKWESEQLVGFKAKGKIPKNNSWKKKYNEPSFLENDDLPSLPTDWIWTNFEQIADGTPNSLKAGPFGSALKKEFYANNGYKIYGQEQ